MAATTDDRRRQTRYEQDERRRERQRLERQRPERQRPERQKPEREEPSPTPTRKSSLADPDDTGVLETPVGGGGDGQSDDPQGK